MKHLVIVAHTAADRYMERIRDCAHGNFLQERPISMAGSPPSTYIRGGRGGSQADFQRYRRSRLARIQD